ncbi:C2H2 transcription factor [Colletotrichum scovillei]|nr:C2H2 transcription factor [Colletotrichum scovillei]
MPRPMQQNSPSLPRETLPPLRPQPSAVLMRVYGINPHAPHTPTSTNTTSFQATMSSYLTQKQQHRGSCQQMGRYSHPAQTTMASSFRRLTAPVPTSGHVLPALRPVSTDSVMPKPDENSPYGCGGVMSNGMDEVERPTHAVGSHGCWSLLCSASRCPAVTTSRTYNAKSTFDPVKNVCGKFHCHHCNETYMRESHLKLHLLRHTCTLCGEACHLDSHFPECSTRRCEPESIRGPSGQLNHLVSLFSMIWKVSAAALIYIMAVFERASQRHEEACETTPATAKYFQYLEELDVSTGMPSIHHNAAEQPHLLCNSATEVYLDSQPSRELQDI